MSDLVSVGSNGEKRNRLIGCKGAECSIDDCDCEIRKASLWMSREDEGSCIDVSLYVQSREIRFRDERKREGERKRQIDDQCKIMQKK